MKKLECVLRQVRPSCAPPAGRLATGIGSMAALIALTAPSAVWAFKVPTPDPEFQVRWDNTLKYAALYRLSDPDAALIRDANADDGDRNFHQGIVSNRLDLLSEFDLRYRNFGARVSGAAWYDDVYHHRTDNDSPATVNSFSVPYDEFAHATEKLHGAKAEFMDAFVFGRFDFDDTSAVVRIGKHSIVYGETLFFGTNGIAAAQGVTDTIKALSVPNSLFKEIQIPINQISGELRVGENWTVGAYYQLEWKRQRILGAGSYFSSTDMLDAGGERLFAGGGQAFFRGEDIEAKDSGQWGVQFRFRPDDASADYGLYFAQYHSKGPQLYLNPGYAPLASIGKIGEYRLVFPEEIRTVGASVSTVLAGANVAAEISFRNNMPLISGPGMDPARGADNSDRPLYAIGKTAHINLSLTNAFAKTAFYDNAQLTAEVGAHRLLSVAKNPQLLNSAASRDAWGFRVLFEPNYYQVMSGLDISIPIGIGINPSGKSAVIPGFNGGVHRGGDVSIGVKGTVLGTTRFSLTYVNFVGPTKDANDPFGQPLADRNYVSLTVQRTF